MTAPAPDCRRPAGWAPAALLTIALGIGAFAAAQAQSPSRAPAPQRNLEPVILQVPGGQRQTLYDASYALVIVASNYRNGWNRLPGVVDDVRAVSTLLGRHGFEVSTVMDPTRDQLDLALRNFVAQRGLREGNRLIVYFSGHGHTLNAGNRKLGYIVPVDAPNPNKDPKGFRTLAYPMDLIQAHAREIESRHALFIFDSCFSGTIFRTRSGVPDAITDRTARPVRQFITAGDEEQTVPDQSIFRRALERGLGEDSEADSNGDRYITGTELGEYLYDQVTNYSRKAQTPRYGKIQDPELDRGDFVFLSQRPAVTALASLPSPATAPAPQAQPQVGAVWKDCADCPELVGLPTGRFTMGSPEGEAGRYSDEGPQRTVTISQRLAVGRVEVTRGQFARFVRASGYKSEAERKAFGDTNSCKDKGGPPMMGMWSNEFDRFRSWATAFPQTDEHPVVCVSWKDAQAYLKWLNDQAPGMGFRLLSEAEWEYAARAGTSTRHYWGNDSDSSMTCGHANVGDAAAKPKSKAGDLDLFVLWCLKCDDGHMYTAPGGRYKPNAFGLHDMTGNISEWVQDVYHSNYVGAPSDGSAWVAGGDQSKRVKRGGSWQSPPFHLRSAGRASGKSINSDIGTGFRIARTY